MELGRVRKRMKNLRQLRLDDGMNTKELEMRLGRIESGAVKKNTDLS